MLNLAKGVHLTRTVQTLFHFLGEEQGLLESGVPQAWSLTQFYSVDFSKSRIGEKGAFSTNAQSSFASVVVDGVLGPPRLARHA